MNYTIGTIGGNSFHSAGQYYLHDKKPEGAAEYLTTSNRVAWTETRNLMGAGPHTAIRRMIDTAQRADELKAAAGIKTTGRKAGGAVFTFSLNWHPDELPNRDKPTMIKAAKAALKTLGLDHLQCLLIAHDDEPQPHVHLIVNRVDFNTGKTAPINKALFHSLDKMCHEMTAPEFQHLSPKRAAKYAAKELGRKLEPDPAKRKAYAEAKRKAANDSPARSPAEQLRRDHRAQKRSDKTERAGQIADHAAQRKQQHRSIDVAAIKADHKARMKPEWGLHFKKQRGELWELRRTERGFAGGFLNAVTIAQRMNLSGDDYTKTLWRLWLGGAAKREAVLKQMHERETKAFSKASYDRLIAAIQRERSKLHTEARERRAAWKALDQQTKRNARDAQRDFSGRWKSTTRKAGQQRPPTSWERMAGIPTAQKSPAHVKSAWGTVTRNPAAPTQKDAPTGPAFSL